MKLKPWYDVVKPREDLREGKPLDASEFAVHLDKVRLGNAPADYKDPKRFLERTFLTENLIGLAGEVVRRLSGITTETSAVFNMTTQFGGGKTHALTLLYHLATSGSKANSLRGVNKILSKAAVQSVPDNCAVAVLVGTEFDSITGRGGKDGTPLRKTPWGEIAFQLGGATAFAQVAKHDEDFIEPKGDVINKFLPADRPCLILMDEVLNYISTYRDAGYHNRLYNFLQSLSETVRGRDNVVLVGSIPASELSYTAADHADQQRLKNLLDRVGKAIIISVEAETSEIIRRRLFEWDDSVVTQDGRVLLPKEAHDTCKAYADWIGEHQNQLPNLISPELARDQFLATYPFHPMVISVFERKWQTLPRFQQTRGILRLLALWVSRAYQEGYKGAHRDPLITLGTAPLEDPVFRAATFEQLGEMRLEAAVTTDIAGKKDAHAIRLDSEATDAIKKNRLHRKVATTIFFESNGGQVGAEAKEASIPEIRLAVGDPNSDIGNIETVLESLTDACYNLIVEKTRYKFSLKENLNKRFADRRASVHEAQIDEEVRREIQQIFGPKENIERIFFPDKSNLIPDRPLITFVIGDLGRTMEDEKSAMAFADQMIRECGASHRTFKSALIMVFADSPYPMREEARKLLAWRAISDDADDLNFDDSQKRQLQESIQKARRDLKESVWRSYKFVVLLAKDNSLRKVDLGLVHSSATDSPISNILLNNLMRDGDVEKSVSPNFLVRNWSPAFKEWSTKAVRDAFYASPIFPRLLNPEATKEIIARGATDGLLAYVGKTPDGRYEPFYFERSISPVDIEISDDMFVIARQTADQYRKQPTPGGASAGPETTPEGGAQTGVHPPSGQSSAGAPQAVPPSPPAPPSGAARIAWAGEVPPQKWMNFYTRVLAKFATGDGLKLSVRVEIAPSGGVSQQKSDEMRSALRELGMNDKIDSG